MKFRNTMVALTALNCFAACVCVGSTAICLGLAATGGKGPVSRAVVPHHGVGRVPIRSLIVRK